MRLLHPRSLTWLLIGRLAVMQAIVLTVLILAIVLVALGLWLTGYDTDEYEGTLATTLRDALARDAAGHLILRDTREWSALRSEVPNLWYVISDKHGERLTQGTVPAEFAPLLPMLDRLTEARIGTGPGGAPPLGALVRTDDTEAGRVQVFTGVHGRLTVRRALNVVPKFVLFVMLPLFVAMTFAIPVATPFVVRRAMRGLGEAATQARRIEIDRVGAQLPLDGVPSEIVPLVEAFNDALTRLDKGYAQHKRFLVDAAHELRTPIAILSTRIASLGPGPERTRLLEDTTRLTVMTGQLLDVQRLERTTQEFTTVDLVAIARKVVIDLAPLAFGAGYEVAFEPGASSVLAQGDQTALERAVTNLVQNAIDHGRRRGTISVRVTPDGRIEVCDEGDGIPPEERENVFEPFRRLHGGGRGAGLGLDLVRKIVALHGGSIEVDEAPGGGACLRIRLPVMPHDHEQSGA